MRQDDRQMVKSLEANVDVCQVIDGCSNLGSRQTRDFSERIEDDTDISWTFNFAFLSEESMVRA